MSRSKRAQPGTIRQHHSLGLEVDVWAVGHEGAVAPLNSSNWRVVEDLSAPGAHAAGECTHVVRRSQVLLALDQYPDQDSG